MTSQLAANNAYTLSGASAPINLNNAYSLQGPIAGTPASVPAAPSASSGLGKAYMALQGVSALAGLAGGISGIFSTASEAERINAQAEIALAEARRDNIVTARDARSFREDQAQAYLNSGVTLDGSPMAVLSSTISKAQEEIDARTLRGDAQSRVFKTNAAQTKRAGLMNALSSGASALTTVGSAYIQANRLGLLGNAKTSLQTPLPPASSGLA